MYDERDSYDIKVSYERKQLDINDIKPYTY